VIDVVYDETHTVIGKTGYLDEQYDCAGAYFDSMAPAAAYIPGGHCANTKAGDNKKEQISMSERMAIMIGNGEELTVVRVIADFGSRCFPCITAETRCSRFKHLGRCCCGVSRYSIPFHSKL
jgi:hypothetical protein